MHHKQPQNIEPKHTQTVRKQSTTGSRVTHLNFYLFPHKCIQGAAFTWSPRSTLFNRCTVMHWFYKVFTSSWVSVCFALCWWRDFQYAPPLNCYIVDIGAMTSWRCAHYSKTICAGLPRFVNLCTCEWITHISGDTNITYMSFMLNAWKCTSLRMHGFIEGSTQKLCLDCKWAIA